MEIDVILDSRADAAELAELGALAEKAGIRTIWVSSLLVLVILSTPLIDVFTIPYGRYNLPYVPVLLTAAILVAPGTGPTLRLLESRLILGIGAVSYGVYIYHYPVLNVVARHIEPLGFEAEHNWLIYGGFSLLVTLVIATGSYVLVERPILKRTGKPTPGRQR